VWLRVQGETSLFEGFIARQRVYSMLASAFLPAQISPSLVVSFNGRSIPAEPFTQVDAELEGKPLHLNVRHGACESYLEAEGARAWVAADGSSADLQLAETSAVDANHWLFGPLLILALARRGVYCLHASSFLRDGCAHVIVGDSGAGKSSLARVLHQANLAKRLTDDISPIAIDSGRLLLLPHFPQLKLSEQITDVAQQYPLQSLSALMASKAGDYQTTHMLSRSQLHFRLMRHTVASRLFTKRDLQAWWAFADSAQQALASSSHNVQMRARHAPLDVSAAMLELYASLRFEKI
jgi:hypothetical protein